MVQSTALRADAGQNVQISTGEPASRSDSGRHRLRSEATAGQLIVGRDAVFLGEITPCDSVLLEGRIEGHLTKCQTIEISGTGIFVGSALADKAEMSGRFQGNLTCRRLLVRTGGQVSGTIRYSEIEIEPGGRISGDVSPQATSDLEADAAREMGLKLQTAFGLATEAAVSEAHKRGFAVPGRRRNQPVEITPDGRQRVLDNGKTWAPREWKGGRRG